MDRGETPDELRARIADLERRLEQVEGRRMPSATGALERILPADVRHHFRVGSREQLLAARALLDHWIETLDQPDEPPAPRENIRIE